MSYVTRCFRHRCRMSHVASDILECTSEATCDIRHGCRMSHVASDIDVICHTLLPTFQSHIVNDVTSAVFAPKRLKFFQNFRKTRPTVLVFFHNSPSVGMQKHIGAVGYVPSRFRMSMYFHKKHMVFSCVPSISLLAFLYCASSCIGLLTARALG